MKSLAMIEGIKSHLRPVVRSKLADGMHDGRNPRNVALDIAGRINPDTGIREGALIELPDHGEYSLALFRTSLSSLEDSYFTFNLRDKRYDRSVKRAMAENRPLTDDKVEQLVARFEAKALQHWAEAIARTEMMRALNRSEWLSIKQAVEIGNLSASAITREWDSAGDNRVRPSHRTMNGQRVGLDEPFVSPTGARMMYPGDTSLGAGDDESRGCRCRVRTVVDWFERVK